MPKTERQLEQEMFMQPGEPNPDQSYTTDWLKAKMAEGAKLNFIQRLQEPGLWPHVPLGGDSGASHLMASGQTDEGKNVAFPTLVYDKGSKSLKQLSSADAMAHAMQSGEYLSFQSPAEADYWATNYKKAFPPDHFTQQMGE